MGIVDCLYDPGSVPEEALVKLGLNFKRLRSYSGPVERSEGARALGRQFEDQIEEEHYRLETVNTQEAENLSASLS